MKKLTEKKETAFQCFAHHVDKSDEEIKEISASLSNLQNIFSKEDIKKDDALTYWAADLSNAGIVNRNGHCISVADTVRFHKNFIHKFVNAEHNRKSILGFIIKSELTDPETKQILTDEEALKNNKPVNISVGFIVWPHADPELSSILAEVGKEDSPYQGLISCSWEVSFRDFNILKGGTTQFEGTIVTDEEEITALENSLRDFGGSGITDDGVPVYLMATGEDLTAIGMGLVCNPAAYVKGIKQIEATSILESDAKQKEVIKLLESSLEESNKTILALRATVNELTEINQKSSQLNNKTVRKNNMKINTLSDINEDNLKELTASEITTFIADELKKKLDDHKAEATAKEAEVAAAKSEAEALALKAKENEEKLAKVEVELEALRNARAIEAAESAFNDRMTALDEEFELSNEVRSVIASQIKDLDEASFLDWKKSWDVTAAEKNKEVIAAKNKEIEEKLEAAKVADKSDDVLATIKAKKESIPLSASFAEDKVASYREAFKIGAGVTIK